MKAQEIMTPQPACCTPESSAKDAARLMAENDCGCIPVIDDNESRKLLGVVTDRDLAVRGIAQGKGPDTPVSEVMSADPSCCRPQDDITDVEQVMAEKQVRRVPVVDPRGCCVGIVAQADLARAAESRRDVSDREVATVVEKISEPAHDSWPRRDVGVRPADLR